MSHRLRTIAGAGLAGLTALGLAACGSETAPGSGPAATVTVTHAQGTTAVGENPDRVVVLDLGVLDTLDALGLGSTVVGLPKGNLPEFQKAYDTSEHAAVGTLKEPDVERIAELDPDVILIGARSAAAYPELSRIAPTVDLTLGEGDLVTAVAAQSTQIGTIFGKESAVEAKLAELTTKVADVRAKASNAAPALVVMTSGGKVSAFGSGSRFGLIHDDLAVPQADATLKKDAHGQAVSFEFIAKTDPGQLFVVDRDAAIGQAGTAAAKVLDNPLVAGTTAWKGGKVTYLDGARWYLLGGGLANTGAMVDSIAAALEQ